MKVSRYTVQTAEGARHFWATSLDAANEVAAQHTPGPWKCTMKGSRVFIDSKVKLSIACLDRTQKISPETAANARLIAAAPELLAALERIRDAYDAAARHGHSIPSELVRTIGESAKITAKAKGY